MKRDNFIFYRSFYEAIKDLPRDIQGEVYTAIMEYSLNGITTEHQKPVARSIFTLIKPVLDANNQRYENGRKGGRKKSDETEQEPNENQNETKSKPNKDVDVDKEEDIPPLPPKGEDESAKTWRDDFQIYLSDLRDAFKAVRDDKEWIEQQERLNPNIDVLLSVEKSCTNFWSTNEGWENKKSKKKTKSINWKSTFANAIPNQVNRVYRQQKQSNEQQQNRYEKLD